MTSNGHRRLVAIVSVGIAVPAFGQFLGYEPAYQLTGESSGDLFGFDIANIGDVTGDGLAEIVIAAVLANDGTGSTYLYSLFESTTTRLTRIHGASRFGWDVELVGDVNADGFADYAVAEPGRSSNDGIVWVVSGADRAPDADIAGHEGVITSIRTQDFLTGHNIGSVPSQGILLIAGRENFGNAYVCHAGTGQLLGQLVGSHDPRARIADQGDITLAGDIVGDGAEDFLVVDDNTLNGTRGALYVIDGTFRSSEAMRIVDRASLIIRGSHEGDSLGFSEGRGQSVITMLRSSVAHKHPVLVVGAFQADRERGSLLAFDASDGHLLYRIDGRADADWYGNAIASLGDLDGDGFDDFVVGSPGNQNDSNHRGYIEIRSGRAGSLLQAFDDMPHSFGCTLTAIGDINRDGVADFAISEKSYFLGTGRVFIYASKLGPCGRIRGLKGSCRFQPNDHVRIRLDVSADLREGTLLTAVLDDGEERIMTLNARGRAAARWSRTQKRSYEVCLSECEGDSFCRTVRCD